MSMMSGTTSLRLATAYDWVRRGPSREQLPFLPWGRMELWSLPAQAPFAPTFRGRRRHGRVSRMRPLGQPFGPLPYDLPYVYEFRFVIAGVFWRRRFLEGLRRR